MCALAVRGGLFGVMLAFVLALTPLSALAQSDDSGESATEDQGERRAPPPRSGGIFGARPPQQTAGGDLTSGEVDRHAGADENDGRIELLVFDLQYAHEVSFRDTYLERFETTFWEAIEASPVYRALSQAERQRRMARSAQMVAGELRDDDAERIAEAIGVTHYLVPRVDVGDSRNYRISVTLGAVGEGEAGRQTHSRDTSRSVDAVDDALEDLTAEAVAQ